MTKLLVASNYYLPYVSGMTLYADRLAQALAADHEVRAVTSRHSPELALREQRGAVTLDRTPVWLKLHKGTMSPSFVPRVVELAQWADVVQLHLPMLEAGLIAQLVPREKLLVTYHCDIDLPPGLQRAIQHVMDASNRHAVRRAAVVVSNSSDYASRSRVLRDFIDKHKEIAPPISDFVAVPAATTHPRIGFLGRFVSEKGLDVLLDAMPQVLQKFPRAELCLAGDHENVAGGSVLASLQGRIDALRGHVTLLGPLPDDGLAAFYSGLSVLALPSINSFETFGMVQVEAMYCGTPVVASDLPGVRRAVCETGMGLLVPPKDSGALAAALIAVLSKRDAYVKPKPAIEQRFSLTTTANAYRQLIAAMRSAT